MKRLTALLCAAGLALHGAALPADAAQLPVFEASFLQGWLCREWDAARWEQELTDMQALGFRSVILQSTVDLDYRYTKTDLPKTDADGAYLLHECRALCPTSLVPYSEEEHALEYALEAAKQTGMTVYIGTVSDNRWWAYGWGVPDAYFAEWSRSNAADCRTLTGEIWAQYGETYGAQIAGFYYNNELWNFDAACDGTDGGAYVQTLAENLRGTLDVIERECPEKPLLISPFFNRDLSGPSEFAAFVGALADTAGLRKWDIIAHQDGGGRAFSPDTLREWCDTLQAQLRGRVTFWVNNESFEPDSSVKRMSYLQMNLWATDSAQRHIIFSWNHYYRTDADFGALLTKLAGDVDADGSCTVADAVALYRWLRHDRIALQCWFAGDLDGSGTLNAADLSLLKRILLTA